MISRRIADEIKKQLVKELHPYEIYLGPYGADSDLDIIVILERARGSRHQLKVMGHRALKDLTVGKNILVYTKKEFDDEIKNKGSYMFSIKERGKKIYAKA